MGKTILAREDFSYFPGSVSLVIGLPASDEITGLVDPFNLCGNKGTFGMCFHECNLFLQSIRKVDIIGIHSCDIGARCKGDSFIQRRDKSFSFLIDHTDPVIRSLELRDNGSGLFGRIIAYEDNLEIPEGLVKNTPYRFCKVIVVPVYWLNQIFSNALTLSSLFFSIELNNKLMAENSIKISVVMPVYNADRFLEESIESILKQTYPNFEFIIVCSNPTNETKRILTKYQKSDARLLIINQEKKGIIFARNFGCQQAKGEYIAVMDADDISLPDRLETQVAFMEKNLDIGIVGSWADIIDERGSVLKNARPPTQHFVIGWHLIFGNCMVHLTAMIRSDVLKKLNYYSQTENGFPEDYDLWTRAFLITKLANIPKSLGKYRMHKSNNSLSISIELQQFCISIQNTLIKQLIGETHHPLLDEMYTVKNSSVFYFRYTINDIQVDFIETFYSNYINKYSLSNSDIKEIKDQISKIMLSYSWSMFHFSIVKSCILLSKSISYSKIAVMKKIFSVLRRVLKRYFDTFIHVCLVKRKNN